MINFIHHGERNEEENKRTEDEGDTAISTRVEKIESDLLQCEGVPLASFYRPVREPIEISSISIHN